MGMFRDCMWLRDIAPIMENPKWKRTRNMTWEQGLDSNLQGLG